MVDYQFTYVLARAWHELEEHRQKRFWDRMDKTVREVGELLWYSKQRGDTALAHMAAFE